MRMGVTMCVAGRLCGPARFASAPCSTGARANGASLTCLRSGDQDVQVAGRQRAALHPLHAQSEVHAQSREPGIQLAARQTQVEQRRQEHIARDSREGLDVKQTRTPAGRPSARGGILRIRLRPSRAG